MRLDCKSTVGGFDSLHAHMTNNNENKFTLVTKDDRQIVRMKSGEPFVYSSRELAKIGKRALENDRKVSLLVVPA